VSEVSLLEPPENPDDLYTFPVKCWDDRFSLWRVCRKANGTWWFSSDGSGRFDLTPPRSGGTCYFGTDATAAILEVFRKQPVCKADVDERSLRRVRVASPRQLADMTDLRARQFGVTKELDTIVPFDIPQQWAGRLSDANLDGLFHHLRHDLRPRATGVSLFGPTGAAAVSIWQRPDADERGITGSDVAASGLLVVPAPPLAGLQVVSV